VLLAAAVFVPLEESAVFPGAGYAFPYDDLPALSPPAVDWILPAGWIGAAVCTVALLLDRLPRRTPLWPVWLDLSGRLEPPRWRRMVGNWALTGALSCAVVAWLITPDGIPAAFPGGVADADAIPLPVGWSALPDDRDCARQDCAVHRYDVLAPAGLLSGQDVAEFAASLRAAGWTYACRPMRGARDWGPRCVHLYRSAMGPDRFTVVVNEDEPRACDADDLLVLPLPRVGCSYIRLARLGELVQQMEGPPR